MAKKYQSFPGMEDILPGEIEKWQWLESKARTFFEAWTYQEIRTPILEPTELFTRSIGETTDIVHKEMYTFEDRGERSMTMRPEMTASVARSVIQNSLIRGNNALALYYIGPMFRAERPQAGRKRQFHQIGAELVNESGVATDLKIIRTLYFFLKYLRVETPKLKLNDLSLLSGEQGKQIRDKLRAFFEEHKSDLDKDSLYRLDKNVLRIFDSKDSKTKKIIAKTPWEEIAPLSDHFKEVTKQLDALDIPYEVDRCLVRGLDYYTGVVFEVSLAGLGAQDAVAGGGSYDQLYKELGGPSAPCTGFSIGMERLLMALDVNKPSIDEQMSLNSVYVAPLVQEGDNDALTIQEEVQKIVLALNGIGIRAVPGRFNRKIEKHLSRADKAGASYTLIKGREELDQGGWVLKTMDGGEEKKITTEELLDQMLTLKKGMNVL